MLMAARFGNGALLDPFTVAFRIPNLARAVFGEGALSTAFLPAFQQELTEFGQARAWSLAARVLERLVQVLGSLVLLSELALGLLLWRGGLSEYWQVLIVLTAIMLPYVVFVCLAAQAAAVLHSLERFGWAATVPIVLNLVWLAGLLAVISPDWPPHTQIRATAIVVVIGGACQWGLAAWALRQAGFRWLQFRTTGSTRGIFRGMLPIVAGLSITQFNTLADSAIAWWLARPQFVVPPDVWYHRLDLAEGTASALYFGQRLYQFPLGVIGVALGTVLFPAFAAHAARADFQGLMSDLRLGLRWVLLLGVPATCGLMMLALPVTELLLMRGEFNAQDARQTADMVQAYSSGVWAYMALLIVHRGFYALGDRWTPLRVGVAVVGLNLIANVAGLILVGASGLPWATSLTAMVQAGVVTALLGRKLALPTAGLFAQPFVAIAAATSVLAVTAWSLLAIIPAGTGFVWQGARLAVIVVAATAGYIGTLHLLGIPDLRQLLIRGAGIQPTNEPEPEPESDEAPREVH